MTPRNSTVIAVAAALLLAAGLFVAWTLGRPARTPLADASGDLGAADTSGLSDDEAERVVEQLPAVIDSAEIKTGWRDDVRGIDLDAMTAAQRTLMVRHANAQGCTCGCGFTLAACRTYDLTCPVSLPRVEALRDSILAGHIRTARGLREAPTPSHP